MESSNQFKTLVQQFHDHFMSDPLAAALKEDFSKVDQVPDNDKEAVERRIGSLNSLAEKIDAFDRVGLPFHQKQDLDLASNELRAEVMNLIVLTGGSPRYTVNPKALQDFLSPTMAYLELDPRDKSSIVESFIKRMNQLGKFLDQELGKLDHPVDIFTNLELNTGSEFPNTCNSIYDFAESVGYQKMGILATSLERASENVANYLLSLREMPKRRELSVGEESAEKWFQYKGIGLSLKKMNEVANQAVHDLGERVRINKEHLLRKYDLDKETTNLELCAFLRKKYAAPKGEVITTTRTFVEKAAQFAYDNGLIEPNPNYVGEVRTCPPHLKTQVPVAAMTSSSPFRIGEQRAIFWINEFSGVEEEMNLLIIPPTVSHELSPGHGYHYSRAHQHPSKIRAWLEPMDLMEGWTTYVAERIMSEMGFFWDSELKIEEQFMLDIENLRLPARVFFTLACLTNNIDYLKNNAGVEVDGGSLVDVSVHLYQQMTGFSKERARSDVESFVQNGTYGALYQTGFHLMSEMESAAKLKLGASYKRAELLEAILQEGKMPLSYIQEALEHKGIL